MNERRDASQVGHRGAVRTRALLLASLAALAPGPTHADESPSPSTGSLKQLSLEELFDLEVTTVSQKPEPLSEAAAAIHVVTRDDLKRMGAMSLPEALRFIPGVEVAQVDARQYAITARGFNGTIANKLLVLIDGRSVYTPLHSGVFWDVQDVFMEDVDQIEVIRGPGATVWGANAVNGVINVITRPASETQGLLVYGGGGTFETGFGGARYGGRLGREATYRLHGKLFERDDSVRPNGAKAGDEFWMGQGGLRVDWTASPADAVTLLVDAYGGHERQPGLDPVDVAGGNAVVKWAHRLSAGSDVQLRTYYDYTDRDSPPIFGETVRTFDFDLRHRFRPGDRHDLSWGVGYRRMNDEAHNSPFLAFIPARVTHDILSGFAQDEWTLVEDALQLTFGSKVEHNEYTGLEVQPSARLAWRLGVDRTLWGAMSRAVRTPSRIDRDLYAPANPPHLLAGGPDFDSEVLHAFELGYKWRIAGAATASIATFHNDYDRLRSVEPGSPIVLGNGLEGRGYGAEGELGWQPLDFWRLDAGYTYLQLELRRAPGSGDVSQITQAGDSPRHQAFLRSSFTLVPSLSAELAGRYVSRLENQQVPAYVTADAGLRWQGRAVEVAIHGRNLFDPRHPEFGRPATRREVPRHVFGKVTWRL